MDSTRYDKIDEGPHVHQYLIDSILGSNNIEFVSVLISTLELRYDALIA